jgi:ribosome-binding factor A
MSRVIQVDLRDPRLRCVISITRVDTSPDLKAAKVHFSVLVSSEKKEEVLQGLTAAAGYIRRELGDVLPLRYIPSLTFVHDDSLELSEAISRAMNHQPKAGEESV